MLYSSMYINNKRTAFEHYDVTEGNWASRGVCSERVRVHEPID
jgi:hypothetical protein